jgi:hypothetical protein
MLTGPWACRRVWQESRGDVAVVTCNHFTCNQNQLKWISHQILCLGCPQPACTQCSNGEGALP